MATKHHYLSKDNHSPEGRQPDFFGLIAGGDTTATFLHGFEITLDGYVVIPELRPKPID
jgi:hypothetical protein